MTPKAQRIAIAEACGFSPDSDGKAWRTGPHTVFQLESLPDYLSDLNAMNEAEKTLSEDEYDNFGQHLVKVAGVSTFSVSDGRKILSATAAQRGGAFLRVKGLWVD